MLSEWQIQENDGFRYYESNGNKGHVNSIFVLLRVHITSLRTQGCNHTKPIE